MDNQKLTVAYVRLSQEDFDKGKSKEYSISIYNQLGLIKSYAKSMGLSIDREYIDDGYSGINFERPEFEKMKDDIDNGLIGTIITKDLSRLGRNFLETSYYICEYFPRNKIRYIAINEKYDSNSPDNYENQIMVAIHSIINDNYVKDASIKRKQVALAKTEEGQFIGFIAPYGYKIKKIKDKRTLEIDEYAAKIVKRIFTEIASGKTRKDVANGLNQDNIVSPMLYMKMTPSKNKNYFYDWSDKIIFRILKNKAYTGKIVKTTSYKEDYHQSKRKLIPIDNRETIDNCHPAIISNELFEAANRSLKHFKRKGKNEYDGLFSGLVVCGTCGRIMTPCRIERPGRKEKYYFKCTRVTNRQPCKSRNIADSRLRVIIEENLKDIINNYTDDDEVVSTVSKDLLKKERPNLKISNLKNDIELHNTNIRNLYLKKTGGEISLQDFVEMKETETKLKEQSETLLKEIIESKNEKVRKEELLEKYNKFINNDRFLYDVVRDLIEEIVIYNDNTVKLSFKFGLGEPKKIKLY